jgi:hypothetical protein
MSRRVEERPAGGREGYGSGEGALSGPAAAQLGLNVSLGKGQARGHTVWEEEGEGAGKSKLLAHRSRSTDL